jgi:hypothetical protein
MTPPRLGSGRSRGARPFDARARAGAPAREGVDDATPGGATAASRSGSFARGQRTDPATAVGRDHAEGALGRAHAVVALAKRRTRWADAAGVAAAVRVDLAGRAGAAAGRARIRAAVTGPEAACLHAALVAAAAVVFVVLQIHADVVADRQALRARAGPSCARCALGAGLAAGPAVAGVGLQVDARRAAGRRSRGTGARTA